MQGLALEARQGCTDLVAVTGAQLTPSAIGLIADQRMTHMRHVHADLVRATGL